MSTREPLSGDVLQSFLPWNFFTRQMGQIGFININQAKTPAPALEQTIVEEVGSYGRQLGRIADALDVLVGTLDWQRMEEPQARAILAFREQLHEIRAIKSADSGRAKEDDLSQPPAVFRRASLDPPTPARSPRATASGAARRR